MNTETLEAIAQNIFDKAPEFASADENGFTLEMEEIPLNARHIVTLAEKTGTLDIDVDSNVTGGGCDTCGFGETTSVTFTGRLK